MGTYNIPYIGFKRFGVTRSHDNISVNRGYKCFDHQHVKLLKAYYAHSLEYYNTDTERRDLEHIAKLGYEVVDPKQLPYKDMFDYVDELRRCDVVFFRGYTMGVAVEVIAALAFGKTVYSLYTHKELGKKELRRLLKVFREGRYFRQDIARFGRRFPSYFARFTAIVDGYMEEAQIKDG